MDKVWWRGLNPEIVRSEEAKKLRLSVQAMIPAHDEEAFIASTVGSVQAQDYPVGEIVVIADNCSKFDRTATFARRAGARVIINPPDPITGRSNKPRAQNAALPSIQSELLLTVDADTKMEPDALGKMVPYFNDPKAFGVSGYIISQNILDYLSNVEPRKKEIKAELAMMEKGWKALKRFGISGWKETRKEWRDYKKENSLSIWERGRLVEYLYQLAIVKPGQNHTQSIFVTSGCMAVFRTSMLRELGGFNVKIFNEDMLITWLARKKGWRSYYEEGAVCYPFEPADFTTFWQQDDRWYRGTFQCLKYVRFNLFFFGVIPALFAYFSIISGAFGPFLLPLFAWGALRFITDAGWETFLFLTLSQIVTSWLAIWIPALYVARKRGMLKLALSSLPASVVTQAVNSIAFVRAMVMELILDIPLGPWIKGHDAKARFAPKVPTGNAL